MVLDVRWQWRISRVVVIADDVSAELEASALRQAGCPPQKRNPSESLLKAKQERLDNCRTVQELAGMM
jgi:hypothetical protein